MNNKVVKIQKDSQIQKEICQYNLLQNQERSHLRSEMYVKRVNQLDCEENKSFQKEQGQNPLKQIPYLVNTIPCLLENYFKASQRCLQSPQFSLEDAIYSDDSHYKSGYFDQFRKQNQYFTADDIFCLLEQNCSFKILIQGQAGVGKTTLIQHIAQEWSQKNILSDRFSEIYFISLKALLNQRWADKYIIDQQYSNEFQINPLKFLIHTNVSSMINNQGYSNIINPSDIKLYNEKILLLVDGFNDISSIQQDHVVCLIIKQIFDQQNIILTSRTNTVPIYWKNKFDAILENIGFNKVQILKYIESHIEQQQLQNQLYKKIIENKQLYKISQIPFNLALICQVAFLIKDNLSSFRIESLYQLYRIFFSKLLEKLNSSGNLESSQQGLSKFSQLELIRLLAYLCQTEQIQDIEIQDDISDKEGKQIIQQDLNQEYEVSLIKNLEQFVKLGLIKKEIDDKKVYSFTHLLFQEFLAAEYFIEKLQNGDQEEKLKVINYISYHRNEDRMLQVLKFMNQIITDLRDQQVLDEFWYSMSCNVEGMLECDITQKVKLLMYLIGSTNSQSERETIDINNTIPNINQIRILINLVVIFNLNDFKYELLHSGYQSLTISSKIESLLEGIDNTKDALKDIKNQIINQKMNVNIESVESYYKNQKQLQSNIIVKQAQINNNKISNQNHQQPQEEETKNQFNLFQLNDNEIDKIQNENQQQEEEEETKNQVSQFQLNNEINKIQNFYQQLQQQEIKNQVSQFQQNNEIDKMQNQNQQQQKLLNKSNGLELALFYSYIDKQTLQNCILEILHCKTTEISTKSVALKIILIQLQNEFEFNSLFYQNIFDWVVQVEKNYQDNLQKYEKHKESQDEDAELNENSQNCFYCEHEEIIETQQEEAMHEQMILILRYLNNFNLSSSYQCLYQMTKYLIHFQKNLLPLVFETIIQIRQQTNQNYVHLKLGQTILFELVKVIANHVLDFPNFLQIWRCFSDEIKNILLDNLECSQCLKKEAKEYPNYINLILQYANNQNHRDQLIFKFYKLNYQNIQTSFLLELLTNISDIQLKEQILVGQTNMLIKKQQQQNNCEFFTEIIQLIEQNGNHQIQISHLEQLIMYYFSLVKYTPRYFQSDLIKQLEKIPLIEEIKNNLLYSFISFMKNDKNLEYIKTEQIDVSQLLESNTQNFINYLDSLFLQDGRYHQLSLDLLIQILLIQNSKNLITSLKFLLKNFFQRYFELEQKISKIRHDEIFSIISSISLPYSLLTQILDYFIPLFKIEKYSEFQLKFIFNSAFEDQQNQCLILENILIKQYQCLKDNSIDIPKEYLIDEKILQKLNKNQSNQLKNKMFIFLDGEAQSLNKNLLSNEQLAKNVKLIFKYINVFNNLKITSIDSQQTIQIFKHLIDLPFNLSLFDIILTYFDETIQFFQDDQLKISISNELFSHMQKVDPQNQKNMNLLLYSKIRYADSESFQQQVIQKCHSEVDKWEQFSNRQLQYSLMDFIKASNKIQNNIIQRNIQRIIFTSIKTEKNNFLVSNVQQDVTFCIQLKMRVYSEFLEMSLNLPEMQEQISDLVQQLQVFIKDIINKLKQDANLFIKIETDYINSFYSSSPIQQTLELLSEHLVTSLNLVYKNEKLRSKIIEKCNFQIDSINNQSLKENLIKQVIKLLIETICQSSCKFDKIKFQVIEIILLIKKYKELLCIPSIINEFMRCLLKYQDKQTIQYIISVQDFCLLKLIPENEAIEIKQNVQQLFQGMLKEQKQNELRIQIEFHKQMCALQNPFLAQMSFDLLVLRTQIDNKYRLKAFTWIASRNDNIKYYFEKVLTKTSDEFLSQFFDHFYEYISEINKVFALIEIIENYQSHFIDEQSVISSFNHQLKKMKYQNKFNRFKLHQRELEIQCKNYLNQLKNLLNEEFTTQKQIEIGLILIQYLQNKKRSNLIIECKTLLKNIAQCLNETSRTWILKKLNYISQLSIYSKYFIALIIPKILQRNLLFTNQNEFLYTPTVKNLKGLWKILMNNERFTLNSQGDIYIEGIKYTINKFYQKKLKLDKELSKILNQKITFFTEQYIFYKPIFQNKSSLKQSSIDKQIYSVVATKQFQDLQEKDQMIIDQHWKLIELMDQSEDIIWFFEKRDVFGKRIIININQEQEQSMNDLEVIQRNFKQRIFNQKQEQLYHVKIYSNPFIQKEQRKILLTKMQVKWKEIANFKHSNCALATQIGLNEEKQKNTSFEGYQILKPLFLVQSMSKKVCNCLGNWDNIKNKNSAEICYEQFQFYKNIFTFNGSNQIYCQTDSQDETNSQIKLHLLYEQTQQEKQYEQLLIDNIQLHFLNDEKLQQFFVQYFRGFVKTLKNCYNEAIKISTQNIQQSQNPDEIETLMTLFSITPLVVQLNLKKYSTINELLNDEQIINNSINFVKFIEDKNYVCSRACRIALAIILKYQNQLFAKDSIGIFKNLKEFKKGKSSNSKSLLVSKLKEKIQSIISTINSCEIQVHTKQINLIYPSEKEVLGGNHASQFIQFLYKNHSKENEINQNMNLEEIKFMKDLNVDFLDQNLRKLNQSLFKNKLF